MGEPLERLRLLFQTNRKATRIASQAFLIALFALVGWLIFAQIRSARSFQAARVGSSSTDRAALISGLLESNAQLSEEVAALEARLRDLEQQGGSLAAMVEELNRLKIVNGLAEIKGPGVRLALDSPISATELQDIVNELRNAGASAIALNDHRLIARSVIISTDAGIAVDGTVIARPFVFMALGDPDTIRVALTRRGGMLTSLQAAHPGFEAEVDEIAELTIPIYSRKLEFRYAQPAAKSP